jgi:hypothetical protein
MVLEKIITMANKHTELRFLAMERSLRATGCTLPLWVIPYDDNKFALPPNASWWEVSGVTEWLKKEGCRGVYRKYQCLLEKNYQFVDADVVFLRNPSEVLANEEGFITSCGHWHNPGQTYTAESIRYFRKHSTTWQKHVFNTGQFACSEMLYDAGKLAAQASHPEFIDTCLRFPPHEQPGINQLVNASGVTIKNLTLGTMQSTWAGDYPGPGYERYWNETAKKPYIIHWAGCTMGTGRPVDELFLNHLTPEELRRWDEEITMNNKKRNAPYKRFRRYLSSLKLAVQQVNY